MNLSTRTTKNFAILVLSIGFSCTTLAQTKLAVVDPNKAPIAAAGIDEVYQLVDAVVTKVDSKTRTVTLKGKDGTVTNFVAQGAGGPWGTGGLTSQDPTPNNGADRQPDIVTNVNVAYGTSTTITVNNGIG